MKRFASLTLNHPVIMGRVTYDSIPEKFRPLSDRTNIVVTRNQDYSEEGIVVCHSMEEAMKEAESHGNLAFVAGGAQIYSLAIQDPRVTRMDLTELHDSI